MATGYTYNIKDGISFKQFVMNCARAFGACIELRDEPLGGDVIPERFEPDNYCIKILKENRKELNKLSKMSFNEAEQAAEEEWMTEEIARVGRIEERRKTRVAYLSMLGNVRDWEPPTPDHVRLKEFMIEQINLSIGYDCSDSYDEKPRERLTGAEWLSQQKKVLEDSIEYYQKRHIEEVERAFRNTKWVSDLRASLK